MCKIFIKNTFVLDWGVLTPPKSVKNMISPQALYFALKAKVRDGIKLDIIW
jgi:hypothetical protein